MKGMKNVFFNYIDMKIVFLAQWGESGWLNVEGNIHIESK